MNQSLSSTSNPMPWDFRPLRGIVRALAYLGVFVMFLMLLVAIPAVFFKVLSDTASASASVLKTIGMVVFVAIVFVAFVALNRRLNLSKYMEKCPAGSIYLLGGSLFRTFSGIGSVNFGENAMQLKGRLGPNLLWPLIIAIVIILILSGGQYIPGATGMLIILGIYNAVLKRESYFNVEPLSVASVRCRGPIVKIRFKSSPVASLRVVTLLLPPGSAEFFQGFDRLFPETLPDAYREALKER